MKLRLLMGAPGSGKSTFIKNHLALTDKYVSRDEIRFSMVSETEEYFSKEKEVFKEYVKRINEGLQNYDVFADATHITVASRNKLLRAITTKPTSIEVIWIKTPLDMALERNEMRKGTRAYVPVSAIRRMYHQTEKPEFEEGFSKIYIVEPNQKIKVLERG